MDGYVDEKQKETQCLPACSIPCVSVLSLLGGGEGQD